MCKLPYCVCVIPSGLPDWPVCPMDQRSPRAVQALLVTCSDFIVIVRSVMINIYKHIRGGYSLSIMGLAACYHGNLGSILDFVKYVSE